MIEAELFGQLLRETRKTRRLGLGQLAEKVDTGSKHLGRVERGEKQPSFELIIALAKALNVSPSAFFEFERARTDQKSAKRQLLQMLHSCDAKQLQKARRLLKVMLEP